MKCIFELSFFECAAFGWGCLSAKKLPEESKILWSSAAFNLDRLIYIFLGGTSIIGLIVKRSHKRANEESKLMELREAERCFADVLRMLQYFYPLLGKQKLKERKLSCVW